MPERGLRQRIRRAISRMAPGVLVLQFPSNAWTGAGWPDLLVLCPASCFLEVKQGRERPTRLQRVRHQTLAAHRVPVYVVHTPLEAVTAVYRVLKGARMAYDSDLLADLDAALGAQAPSPEPAAEPASELQILPEFEETVTIGDAEVILPVNGAAEPELTRPSVEDILAARDAQAEAEDAPQAHEEDAASIVDNLVDTLETMIVELRLLSAQLALLREAFTADRKDAEPVMTAEAPAPRRRRRTES
jgi:hypothetical protein